MTAEELLCQGCACPALKLAGYTIGDLKNIGVAIGEGVSLTSALLDDIGKGVDKTDGSLQKRTQKAKVLQKQVQGNCGLYVCIFLLIILLVFNISSKGFRNI